MLSIYCKNAALCIELLTLLWKIIDQTTLHWKTCPWNTCFFAFYHKSWHLLKLNGKENRRWWLLYVFVLPLALLWNMWKIKIIDLMTFHLWIFLQNGGMFMKVKSPGTLLNTIIIYICLSFQRGFPPHTWAEPGSTPRLPPFPCIPQTSAAPTKQPIQYAVSANNCNNNNN